MRKFLALAIMVISVLGAAYVAIWVGIISPILTISEAIDNNTITASLVGREVIYFFLREFLAWIIIVIGMAVSAFVHEW